MVKSLLVLLLIITTCFIIPAHAVVELDADNDDVLDSTYKVNQDNMVDGSCLSEIADDDGDGSGLDADKVDGQDASDLQNADNLNDGSTNIIPTATQETNWDLAAVLALALDADQDGDYTDESWYQNLLNIISDGNSSLIIEDDGTGLLTCTIDGTVIFTASVTGLEFGNLFVRTTLASDTTAEVIGGFTATAGESGNMGQAVYISTSDKKAYLADGDASGEAPAWGILTADMTADGTAYICTECTMRIDSWNWSAGYIYLSDSAGGLTQTPLSTSTDIDQALGTMMDADTVYFKVDHINGWATVE